MLESSVGDHATANPGRIEGTSLPYGPLLTRLLRPVQRGFLFVNRWFVRPALRSPFGRLIGNPFTAYLLLLRTRGRRSGQVREAPLGYVILDCFVYCVAGYGTRTPWYLNLIDNPTVEVVLPGRRIRGAATPVTDDAEWLRAYRALIAGFGLVGRLVDGDPRRLDDATLLATHRSLPVVRIRSLDPPGPIVAGAWDPGGGAWRFVYGGTAAGLILALRLQGRRAGRTRSVARRQGSPRPSG
jgi:deazaflavin-dependent oxidoreductase (nitroreductase family)